MRFLTFSRKCEALGKLLIIQSVVIGSSLIAGCAPPNVSLPSGSLSSTGSPAYSGFTGATGALTVAATKVKVTWSPTSDPAVVAYNIYDATLFFAPKLLKTVSASSSEVTLTGLTTQTYYAFRVRAADKDNKEDGNTKDVKAIPYGGVLPAEVLSSTSVKIPFNDGSNADAVNILCTTLTNPVEELLATVTDVTGTTEATINNLVAGTVYSCRAALVFGDFVDNNTVKTTFTPMGTAASLMWTAQPGSAAAGANLSVQPIVRILDSNGTLVSAGPDSTAVITLTVATGSPTVGTLRGTAAVAAVKGVATFSGLNFQEAGSKIVQATKEDTSSQPRGSASLNIVSNPFTITPGSVSPTTSTIAISPAVPPNAALVANGSNSYTVTIFLADTYGNPISGTRPVFASNLAGDTMTQPAVNTTTMGIATGSISSTVADTVAPFRSLSISSPSGLSGVTVLAPFVPGTASKLAFTTQPSNSPAGNNGLGVLRVAVQDAQGNIVNSGAGSTSAISMAINANVGGAVLTGTTTVNAVAGIATFTDLGISKTGTAYKLLATSGGYTAAYSNSFNVTAGTPNKISITGPSTVISGGCSTAISVQLQDLGNNPANAVQNTPVTLGGLGSGSLYSSSTCTGSPVSATTTFTAGTNLKTFYFKDNKGEGVTITGTDPSAVLTMGSLPLNVSPNKISLLAQNPGPTAMTVVAGQCSSAIVITPMGENGAAAPLFATANVAITGIAGSSALLYSDAGCTNLLSATNITLPVTSSPINIYLKDPKAEALNLSITDIGAVMTTTSGLQSVTILPSVIGFTGPVSVVSGACSTAFTLSLRDTQGNLVTADANRTLNISGLAASSGMFYTSSSCASGGSKTSITIPQGNSSLPIYFKNTAAETVTVRMTDPLLQMSDSPSITIAISPSAYRVTAPTPASSKTTACAGPFVVNTMDGSNTVTAAISTVRANLSGAGTGGGFFSNASCTTSTSQLTFNTGVSAQNFYFKGQTPQATLTFNATDNGGVLTTATATWTVTAAMGFIGTAGTTTDAGGNTVWFTSGTVPMSARQDAARSVAALHFDSTKTYLYVADVTDHKVLKYNYATQQYIGWIGGFWSGAGIGLSGSKLATPSNAACVSVTTNQTQLPGWCTGGLPTANGNTTNGNFNQPTDLTDDGTYLYVLNRGSDTINRYDAVTGAYRGWVGRTSATPTAAAVGGPASCTSTVAGNVTPGWCMGGNRQGGQNVGDGSFWGGRAIAYSNNYIYASTQGAILRFLASDGSFQGWVGKVGGTPPTGGAANCTTRTSGQITPGWCVGGTNQNANPRSGTFGGVNDPVDIFVQGGVVYVVHTDNNGTVSMYDETSGAFQGFMSSLAYNWVSPRQMTSDGSNFYFADWTRLIQVDPTGLVLGWTGKVSNNNSMSGNAGCSSLLPNTNTPGFCLGGTSKPGIDEGAFAELTAIAYDGAGNVLTGQGGTFPAIKRFNATTGVYNGSLGAQTTSPTQWSDDTSLFGQYYGFDDASMFTPTASYNDGTYTYLAEGGSTRVKKINTATGTLVGWIGGITTVPTGGAAGCTSANAMGPSPGWCLGAMFNPNYLWTQMIPSTTDGIMNFPVGITSDGTHLYVVDKGTSRVLKFTMAGAYVGWIGASGGTAPTGGASGCIGNAQGVGVPGWCTGGTSQQGVGDGMFNDPTAITYLAGNLYILDSSNHRVVSVAATTGAFNGWIGRTNAAPGTCATGSNGGYTVSTSGWCRGGTAQQASSNDRGGGFSFWSNQRGGITNDGTFLYIANFFNIRVDKYSLAGVWQGAVSARESIYTRVWSNDPTTVAGWGNTGCSYPIGLYVNSTHLYGVAHASCQNGNASIPWKLTLSTGTMYGWQGGIQAGQSPTAGDPGCSGAVTSTPGWCQGGRPEPGYRLGQFAREITGISGDANFVYINDENSHRLTRLPK